MPKNKSDLQYRSDFLEDVFEEYVDKKASVLEIGAGDWRNVDHLIKQGWKKVRGIDSLSGSSIEDEAETEYDVIFTMSTLFLIPPENAWVFEKIARMAKDYIITIEGETDATTSNKEFGDTVWGRNYTEIFKPFGFEEVYKQDNVFNVHGVLRVLKNEKSN